MFKIIQFLPFFQTDDSETGKTAEEIAAEQAANEAVSSKTETDEPSEYEKLIADVNANREAILTGDEGEKPEKVEEASKTPEEIAAEAASKIAEQQTTIDDEFISNVDQAAEYFGFSKLDKTKVIEALKSFKGRKLDNDVLKSHVHSQVTLLEYKEKGNKKPEKPDTDNIFDTDKTDIENEVQSKYSDKVLDVKGLQEDEVKSLNVAKQNALFNMLKPHFKDLTLDDLADKESVNDFIATLQVSEPLDADDFKSAYRKANAQLTRETNEYVDRAKNWRVHLKTDAEAQIEKFAGYLKSKGLTPEQLETEIDQDFVIKNIIQDKTGRIKPGIVGNYKDDPAIFVLNSDKFYQELVDYFDPRVTEILKKVGAKTSFEKKTIKSPNPSQSGSSIQGNVLKPEVWAKKGEIPDDATDFEAMQQALDQNRKAIKESN